jgi:predicted DNA-binding transcriptional regulator YafY
MMEPRRTGFHHRDEGRDVSNKMGKNDGPFAIPTIKGRIAERLQRAESRVENAEGELDFPEGPGQVVLENADERGAVALACLILENLREQGGTRAPKRALESVARKTLATFDRKEVMEIEIEAYEILLWLARSIDPEEWSHEETPDLETPTPDNSKVEIIQWAIANKEDLQMDYYTHGRGELTHREVSPISLEAETYLHGWCHLRRDERVFRVSRIADVRPADKTIPWETEEEAEPTPPPEDQGDHDQSDSQMSLLD